VCYTCVRECPAKAIRIADGQAEVLPERCIGCGNCVRVCSQDAKLAYDSTVAVGELLNSGARLAACVAPSFPAAFPGEDYREVVGRIHALGFDLVTEVGFGADLVAREYRKLLLDNTGRRYIATTCPAIVGYVERYHPALVESLAPIVSPMVAAARVLRSIHGADLKIVFIGPCIAKKGEMYSANLPGELDEVLTFVELEQMFRAHGVVAEHCTPRDFDPPHAGSGALFPISRGLLQAAGIEEDLMTGAVVATDGRTNFTSAIREFERGDLDARLLEVLACSGCIMGPGIDNSATLFSRRSRVAQYVRQRRECFDADEWQRDTKRFSALDLGRSYRAFDQRVPLTGEERLRAILERMGKHTVEDELNCGACGYESCRDHAIAIHKGLAETEMCLPYTIERLKSTVGDLAKSHERLARTQEALVQSEKLASMGQLAAGIAHEINNPLNVVLMYAHLMLEEVEKQGRDTEDLTMIATQADRCRKIVAGLLHFARQNKVFREPADVRRIVEDSLATANVPQGVEVRVEHNLSEPMAWLDKDQIIQVLTNMVINACAAMPDGGRLTLATRGDADRVELVVEDTGCGIAKEHLAKIFDPFFTTKRFGEGTGLGLAVAYGIVKMHSGDIRVVSNSDPQAGPTGTRFTVFLPRRVQSGALAGPSSDPGHEQQAGVRTTASA
jgi:signal transduction histidine kinase/Fe-S-cluster-containing hydrogenase component 2